VGGRVTLPAVPDASAAAALSSGRLCLPAARGHLLPKGSRRTPSQQNWLPSKRACAHTAPKQTAPARLATLAALATIRRPSARARDAASRHDRRRRPQVQAFASVRLETDHKNHCLVGGALGGLGSGQSIGDASFPSVPQDAMDETHRKPHSCCWFRGEMLEAEGARRVRVDLWDYDTFSENDYLGGALEAAARRSPPEQAR